MIETAFGYVREGDCEEGRRESSRVFSMTTCSNPAKYKITFDNGRTINVCGTHHRQYYKRNFATDKPIKGLYIKQVIKVEEIKTGKIIYENVYPTGSTH